MRFHKMLFSIQTSIFTILLIFMIIIDTTTAAFAIDIYKQNPTSLCKLKNFSKSTDENENESIMLYKFMDSEYYGKISIGHPAKEFKFVFDTTWGDSWVPSERCSISEIACMLHTRYDSRKSSTYQADGTPINITTENVSLLGFLSRDDFHLPHKKLRNQTFVEMTHMSKSFISAKADGIIGLGFQPLSYPNTIPFFYNLFKQKVVSENVFTIYMNRDETTEKAGKLILGGTERKHVKEETLTYVQVIEKVYWKIQLDRITVETGTKTFVVCGSSIAIIDSSVNTIRGPKKYIERINTLINAKNISPKFGRYMVKCREYAKLPHLSFTIGGKDFIIESKYYVQRLNIGGIEICLSPFIESDVKDVWELGGAFLMQFYTEYYFDGRVAIGETKF